MTDPFFTGHWKSSYHSLQIDFNENVWRLLYDGFDEYERSLFGLFSENDGASFSLDYSLKDSTLDYDTEFAEAEFFSRMFNMDNQCQRLGETHINISNLNFVCGRYQYHNEKYGEQLVTRALHINQTYVIAIGMAWPFEHEQSNQKDNNILIPKFQLLIDHLKINQL